MVYPFISGAGVYRSELSGYRKDSMSPVRTVEEYEFELFTDNFYYGIINDRRIEYKKNTVLIARPGDRRCSRCHFSCHYLHMTVNDNEIKAVIDKLPSSVMISDTEKYKEIFEKLSYVFPTKSNDAPLEATGLLLLLLSYLTSESDISKGLEKLRPYAGKDVIYSARTYINENYSKSISLCDIAASVHLTPNYFHRLFTSVCGMTPLEYLTEIRMSRAKYLLLTSTHSVTDIASECGFGSYNYFSLVFKKNCGISPRSFRNNANNYYKL